MKYLIVGLGNIGEEYKHTRHNIGFDILDHLATSTNTTFQPSRYGDTGKFRLKGRSVTLLKPSTFMNLSGNAVRYWLQQESVELENLFVVTDDIALPLGKIRIRMKGSDAGHNGLKHIIETLKTENFSRLRFGIGNDFPKGYQVDFVLGKWSSEEWDTIKPRLEIASQAIENFVLMGVQHTMNHFNNK
ncbi:MAG TPA: aminoacyl-tRNA hydrolase [Salinivirgaceae bacterium]|nr:aminoacyl-tRNA hydrolase [Salinivirgaceae bacterium]